jgi:hypothetical protein
MRLRGTHDEGSMHFSCILYLECRDPFFASEDLHRVRMTVFEKDEA